jgi:subtilisin family serine protease
VVTRAKRLPRLWFAVLAIALAGVALHAASGSPSFRANAAPAPEDPSPATTRQSGKLSARLAAIALPTVWGLPAEERAAALGLPAAGPGSLRVADGRVLVNVRLRRADAAALAALRDAGAEVLGVARRYSIATALVAPSDLRDVAAVASVRAVSEELAPIVGGNAGRQALAAAGAPAPSIECRGAATSEGDAQLRADEARARFDVDGSGVTVGVISDSYDTWAEAKTHAVDDVASGDLPGPGNPCGRTSRVRVLEEIRAFPGIDEGRAMMQLVHDLAPGSKLAFASGANGMFLFADAIRRLRRAGSDVIVDDLIYFAEPMFQDGPIGTAINDVVRRGAAYYTAAGNENVVIDGRNAGSWETPAFRAIPCPRGIPRYQLECQDFNPGARRDGDFSFRVNSGGSLLVDVQWNEPWFGVDTDLDIYLVNAKGRVIAAGEDANADLGVPFEFVSYENRSKKAKTVRLVIARFSGSRTPRLKFVLLSSRVTGVEYNRSNGGDTVGPAIFGHCNQIAMCVAAVPYDDSSIPEDYSSPGPVTHYWAPATSLRPARALERPLIIAKPDFAATDGGQTTFFIRLVEGIYRFYGTSAAAPHAAAIAALMLDANPSASTADVNEALRRSGRKVGTAPRTVVGRGLIDAVRAVRAMLD